MEILGFYVSNWLLGLSVFLVGLYYALTWRFGELKQFGYLHPRPWPILGNMGHIFVDGIREMDFRLIKKYGKVYGFYEGHNPVILVGDVNILRNILIKDFHKFVDRRPLYFRGVLKHGVFDERGNHWKNMRSLLTPAFSTGKLKPMYRLMNQCADNLVRHIDAAILKENGIFETKGYAQSFTMDVIACTAFGIKLDSQEDPKDPFNVMAKKVFDITTANFAIILWVMFSWTCPFLDKFNLLRMFNKDAEKFFITVLQTAIDERVNNDDTVKQYKDFLNLMLDKKLSDNIDEETKQELEKIKGDMKKTGLSTEEVMGNSLLFFAAGFETTATTLSFLLYFLATNPDVQDRLAEEINEVIGNKHEANYEETTKMTYMDKVINETLRLSTPITKVDRQCSEAVTYEGYHIPKGMIVNIPILALHYDPEAWPDPEKFDPERFSPEEKAKRDPMYFMPFGAGPRTCIGNRLALMEIKLTLVKLLKTFIFTTCDKTQIPLVFRQDMVLSQTTEGLYIEAKRR